MKKLITLLFLLGLAVGAASAQNTTFSATLTDGDGQTWNNGTWSASLYSPNGPPFSGGVAVSPTLYSGSMNSSGFFSQVLPSNSSISPIGSPWRFTICPDASASCSQITVFVTGSTQDGSAALSAGLTAPRFAAGPYSYGYSDTEVVTTPLPGGTYYSVTALAVRVWSGSSWSSGASSGGVTAINSASGWVTFLGTGVSCISTVCTF